MVRRHQRQTTTQDGGIISKEAAIHVSNLAIEDPKDGNADAGRLQISEGRAQGPLCQALGEVIDG